MNRTKHLERYPKAVLTGGIRGLMPPLRAQAAAGTSFYRSVPNVERRRICPPPKNKFGCQWGFDATHSQKNEVRHCCARGISRPQPSDETCVHVKQENRLPVLFAEARLVVHDQARRLRVPPAPRRRLPVELERAPGLRLPFDELQFLRYECTSIHVSISRHRVSS